MSASIGACACVIDLWSVSDVLEISLWSASFLFTQLLHRACILCSCNCSKITVAII
uniref:Uncharacterized protein n=1 Tax=Arundo donax TaxID=35708 RepID=A0A0A8Z7I6_ARUDO